VLLQNIDKFIFAAICLVFVLSTFMPSDAIGLAALAAAGLSFVKLLTKPGARLEASRADLWLLAYFMFVVVSLFGSTMFTLSLHGFFKTLTYLLFYLSVRLFLKDNKDQTLWVLGIIALHAGFQAVAGFLQSFSYSGEISTWQDVSNLNPEDVMTRVYGTLKPLNPNLLGGYLVAAIPIMLGMLAINLMGGTKKPAFLPSCLLVLLSVTTLFATGCRGAYLAFGAILIGIFALSAKFFWKNYKKWYLCAVGVATAMMTSAVLLSGSLRARVFSMFAMRQDSSNSFRFNVYQSSWEMFKDNWLLGIGVGNQNFREIYGLYMKTGFDALSAYNIYLEIAVESGIFALIAFCGFLFVLIKNAVKFITGSENTADVIIVSAVLVSICAVLVHGLVDTVFFRPQIQFIFWTTAAICIAKTEIQTEAKTEVKEVKNKVKTEVKKVKPAINDSKTIRLVLKGKICS